VRDSGHQVVVVGAGLAGLRCVEDLRRHGYADRIVLVGDEPHLPYDRPPLSKEFLVASAPATHLRTPAAFAELDVDARFGVSAQSLDVEGRALLVDGEQLKFSALVIATGARPRTLPGLEPRDGVHELRTLDDALRLRSALVEASRVVVVGAGFIGSEVASSARSLGLEVTIAEQAPAPLVRVLGREMGAACAGLHTENGTRLLCGVTVTELVGERKVEAVRLSDGSMIAADLVLVGAGVEPDTRWLEGSGLELDDGVVCDRGLRAAPGIYAIGDVARWENGLFGRRMRVEQWTNAAEQARHVAGAIAGVGNGGFTGSNYFWSDQYGVRIQFVGLAEAEEVAVVDGDPQTRRFAACYRRGERLIGTLAVGSPRIAHKAKRLIERGASWDEALAALAA
jgi:NADPH-dependent 2,4-dienoyl-CoA reductase/sulfur reductase-like enzyme